MDLKIQPRSLKGTVQVPPSKSMAHRAILAAALAQGESIVKNVQLSDDIRATLQGVQALGAQVAMEDINDRVRLKIKGIDLNASIPYREIDCNESGSTLRFLIPIASLIEGTTVFKGQGKLGTRPLDTYQEIYSEQNLEFNLIEQEPLKLKTQGKLSSSHYEMVGNVSSQFITGMLYTLPLLEGDSSIQITTPLESIGYINMTLQVLDMFGIHIDFDSARNRFDIPGNQSYQAQDMTVEGDYSQAAFYLVAAALGNPVTVKGLQTDSLQGDRQVLDILQKMGCQVQMNDRAIQVDGSQLKADFRFDGGQIPDIIPILALLACLAPGKTEIYNLERLRIKESDRLHATQQELTKLGAYIQVDDDRLIIKGVPHLEGEATIWSYQDHRMAMMLAIASTRCQEAIILRDAECVRKSYPNFWQDFQQLGGQINEWNMG